MTKEPPKSLSGVHNYMKTERKDLSVGLKLRRQIPPGRLVFWLKFQGDWKFLGSENIKARARDGKRGGKPGAQVKIVSDILDFSVSSFLANLLASLSIPPKHVLKSYLFTFTIILPLLSP